MSIKSTFRLRRLIVHCNSHDRLPILYLIHFRLGYHLLVLEILLNWHLLACGITNHHLLLGISSLHLIPNIHLVRCQFGYSLFQSEYMLSYLIVLKLISSVSFKESFNPVTVSENTAEKNHNRYQNLENEHESKSCRCTSLGGFSLSLITHF